MRKASAPLLFVVGLLVLALVGGATFGLAQLVGFDDDEGCGTADTVCESPGSTTPTTDPGLSADQVAVTGVATAITVDGAVLAGIAVPTVVTPSAGLGAGARFEAVAVDGEVAAVVWDAGRPLDFADDAPLRLAPAPVNLVASSGGVTITFVDDTVHGIADGDYQILAPVAVSTGGLGSPRDGVAFTASESSTVAFTGGANTTVAPFPLAATGPGRVLLEGTFEIRHPDGSLTPATRVELPTGSFRLNATPRADGTGYDLVDVLLEGPITAT